MRITTRLLALATLLSGALAGVPGQVVQATVAHAAVAPAVQVVVGQDGALVGGDATLSSLTSLAPASSSLVYDLSGSGDGSRVALVTADGSATSALVRTRVVVRDATGRVVRALDARTTDVDAGSGALVQRPALDAHGDHAVWSVLDFDHASSALMRADVASGPPVAIPGSTYLAYPQYLDSSTVLALDTSSRPGVGGRLRTIPLAGGAPTTLAGLTSKDALFAISPDGSRIAYITHESSDPASPLRLYGASISKDAGTWTVGTPTPLAPLLAIDTDDDGLSFSQDGDTVYWSQNAAHAPLSKTYDSDIWSVPFAGGVPLDLTNTPGSIETSAAGVAPGDSTPPGPVTDQPFVLGGASATVQWTNPTDTDLSVVQVTRSLGGTVQKTVWVPAPLTSFVDTGLTVGSTYSYDLTAVDRSGNPSTVTTRQLTAYAPVVTVADPSSTSSVTATFPVGLPAGSYEVTYRTNAVTAAHVLPLTSGRSYAFPGRIGSSYRFWIKVSDTFGNSSAVTPAATTEVPYDQSRATFIGAHVSGPYGDRYLGSATVLRAGSSARTVINGTRLQVIGERCRSCGVMDVYVDGRRLAGLDTYAGRRQARQVLWTRPLTPGNHTVIVRSRGTAGHPNVILDAFGVRH